MTLGVRAEDVQISLAEQAPEVLAMEVVLTESVGHASLVTLVRDGWRLTARLAGRRSLGNQQTVGVALIMEHAHLFDRSTGLALCDSRPDGG